jgi:hypothetical protein
MAAGNMSYAARDAEMIEPHTTYLFAQLRRYAAQPSLLNERDSEEVQMLYRVMFALSQIASYVEFKHLFVANMDPLDAVFDAVKERPHAKRTEDLITNHVFSRLFGEVKPLDISKVSVQVVQAGTGVQSAVN